MTLTFTHSAVSLLSALEQLPPADRSRVTPEAGAVSRVLANGVRADRGGGRCVGGCLPRPRPHAAAPPGSRCGGVAPLEVGAITHGRWVVSSQVLSRIAVGLSTPRGHRGRSRYAECGHQHVASIAAGTLGIGR